MTAGRGVEERLRSARGRGALIFGLIDPDPSKRTASKRAMEAAADIGVDAFLVGGSTFVDRDSLDEVIDRLREIGPGKPVILFPGNVNGLTPKADAVLFMSMLNSEDVYYIIGAQVIGAPLIRKYGLEPLPTAYLVIYDDTAVAHVGRARSLPPDKPELAAMYAMAAEMLGMRFLYLEGGSGSSRPVDPSLVSAVRRSYGGFLIVGGGLRDPRSVAAVVGSGADGIVLGTALETLNSRALREMAEAAKGGGMPGQP